MTAKIKICGLTRKEDAKILNQNKVDFAGFVLFFPKSRRCLTISEAKEIMAYLNPEIKKAAVTVSPTLEQVKQIEAAGFDILQVHGTLYPEVLEAATLPIFRAVNISCKEDLAALEQSEKIKAYVLDGKDPGNGKSFDWNLIKPQLDILFYKNEIRSQKQFMLAGGLTPENAVRAIQTLHPDIVDVSSGVELPGLTSQGKSPGKDAQKVQHFCQNVRKLSVYKQRNKANS